MKHIAVALMLNFGVASIYAQQKPVTMTSLGSGAPSAINLLLPNTTTGEDLAGDGTLGPFMFRNISVISLAVRRFRVRRGEASESASLIG
jgi:hypothetical protein